jgi:hypothetical protein
MDRRHIPLLKELLLPWRRKEVSMRYPLVLAFAGIVAGCLATAVPARGCEASHCEEISPGCKQCVIDGGEAGAACRQVGGCYCVYFQCGVSPLAEAPAKSSDWRGSFEPAGFHESSPPAAGSFAEFLARS